jgi:hypothetical protein
MYFILCVDSTDIVPKYRIVYSLCGCFTEEGSDCKTHKGVALYKNESYPFLWDFIVHPDYLYGLLQGNWGIG